VQRWLGHHSPAFTLATYVHLLREDLGEPLDVTRALGVATQVAIPAASGGLGSTHADAVDPLHFGACAAETPTPPEPAGITGVH
jgi:hypothetical protein